MWVQSLGWKNRWNRAWQPTPVFLPGEFLGQRRLVGSSPEGWTRLKQLSMHTLDLEMVLESVKSECYDEVNIFCM